jgi:hypothetical protein
MIGNASRLQTTHSGHPQLETSPKVERDVSVLVKVSLRYLPGFSLACFARIAFARASRFAALVSRPVSLNSMA